MTVWYEILIISAFTVSIVDFFVLLYLLNEEGKPKKVVSEREKEKDAQIILLRSRVVKLKEENAVLEMEKEECKTITDSWVQGYAKLEKDYAELQEENTLLCATNSTLSKQVIEWEQKYSELKATYNETKADCDAHWEQLCSIMRTHPEVFPESNGVDDRWEGDKGGLEE